MNHGNADALSRLPLPEVDMLEHPVYHVTVTEELPVSSDVIREAMRKDPVLSRLHDYVLTGWPERCPEERMMPYFSHRHEMSCKRGCVLWGTRVIVPEKYREQLLNELHEEHQGVVRTKA